MVATDQLKGRGQRRSSWYSKPEESLSLSLFKRFEGLLIHQQFGVNCAVSLGVYRALQNLGVAQCAIKWPNDIMADGKKLCGILIENQLRGTLLNACVIGVGINVNNILLPELPNATSMKLQTNTSYHLQEVLEMVTQSVISELNTLIQDGLDNTMANYEAHLFRKDVESTFENRQGETFIATIKGISSAGALMLEHRDQSIQNFTLKEVRMHY